MTIVDTFVEWAHFGLMQNEKAQAYLLGRGASEDQWRKHRIGYVAGDFHPDPFLDPAHSNLCGDKSESHRWCDSCRLIRWSSVWQEEGEDGPKVRIVGRRHVGSIVMPLTSYSGSVVGFQTRSIEGKEFDSFTLSRRPEGYFFGLAQNMASIWAKRKVFVVEGPPDHLVFERLVATNVVGLTTNTSNTHQTRFFRRFVDEIILLLDMDKAGRDGVESIRVKLNSKTIKDVKYCVKNLKGDRCKDVNEVWKTLGDAGFSRYFTNLIERV